MNKEIKKINNSKDNLKDKLKDEISDLKKLKNSASPEGFFSGIKEEISKIKQSLSYKNKTKEEISNLSVQESFEKDKEIAQSKQELSKFANVVITNNKNLNSDYNDYLGKHPDLVGQVNEAKNLHNIIDDSKNDPNPIARFTGSIANQLIS